MGIKHENELALWLQSQDVCADLNDIVLHLVSACTEIDGAVQSAALAGQTGAAGTINVQGEEQKELDIFTNDLVVQHLSGLNQIAALVSEEVDHLIINPAASASANYAICFDPVDGSSNIETNGVIGTIFSVLELSNPSVPATDSDILGAAQNQVAAGYVIYGPATILVLTTGKSVASFVLDKETGHFLPEKTNLKIPKSTNEFAINMAYVRFWEPAITAYIDQCVLGKTGPRKKDFGMRWTAAMVADVHRIFVRGGIFIYPALSKPGSENGKLRFLYEANPMAMLVEVAGGRAQMAEMKILDFVPKTIHQRVPVILGSREEVEVLGALFSR